MTQACVLVTIAIWYLSKRQKEYIEEKFSMVQGKLGVLWNVHVFILSI